MIRKMKKSCKNHTPFVSCFLKLLNVFPIRFSVSWDPSAGDAVHLGYDSAISPQLLLSGGGPLIIFLMN